MAGGLRAAPLCGVTVGVFPVNRPTAPAGVGSPDKRTGERPGELAVASLYYSRPATTTTSRDDHDCRARCSDGHLARCRGHRLTAPPPPTDPTSCCLSRGHVL